MTNNFACNFEEFGCNFLQIVSKDCQIGQICRRRHSNIKRNSIDDTEIVENSDLIKNYSNNVFFPTVKSQKQKFQCKDCLNQSQCVDCLVKQDKVTRHRVHFSDDIYDLI